MDQYKVNSDIHGKDTTQSSHLYQIKIVTLSDYNCHFIKEVPSTRVFKILKNLAFNTKDLSHNIKQFKLVLRNFLHLNSCYTLEEYFNYNSI